MKIAVGCDHGGLHLKQEIKELLSTLGHEVEDFGTHSKILAVIQRNLAIILISLNP